MDPSPTPRRDPDTYLRMLQREEERATRGSLKIFLGMCAGVGKTYAMLQAARAAGERGIDVVVAWVETHGRPETEALTQGLELLPRRNLDHRGITLEEMDIDAVLARRPALVIVDELAHTNVPGSRHEKRWQDVQELLTQGIDVLTTLNVQHIDSRSAAVREFTGTTVRETVPDTVFESADEIEIIDIPVNELLVRLAEGRVYAPEKSRLARERFFRRDNLTALRELTLRATAERLDHQLRDYIHAEGVSSTWKSGRRIVVGVGPGPHSAVVLRWARQMASALGSALIAVVVRDPRRPHADRQGTLAANLALARQLGATIVTTDDADIARALIRIAREQRASQILVGKSGERSRPWRQTLIDRLTRLSGDLDVHIIGGTPGDHQARDRSTRMPDPPQPRQYAIAAGSTVAAALGCLLLAPFTGYYTVALVFLFVVTLLSFVVGRGPILLAATLSAVIWDVLFIPPHFTFAVERIEDAVMIITYFVIAFLGGMLTARRREHEGLLRLREQRTSALYSLTRDLAGARSVDDVATAAVTHMETALGAACALFISDHDGEIPDRPHPASTYRPPDDDRGVVSWVYWNEQPAGHGTETLPMTAATYHPLVGPRYTLGVIGLRDPDPSLHGPEQDSLVESFIRQITLALDREFLNEMTAQSALTAESERLYASLFNSISHELRTPLAAIISATDAMIAHAPASPDPLADEIRTAALRLNRLVENLLDMSRIESDRIAPAVDWCDIGDVINAAVDGLRAELATHAIEVTRPDGMPLIRSDFGLLTHALTNILHNACVHTPQGSSIGITAMSDARAWSITVSDDGPGLPDAQADRVFDKFYRGPGALPGGTGLGLSIARALTEALGGVLTAGPGPEGGAAFTLRFPHVDHRQEE